MIALVASAVAFEPVLEDLGGGVVDWTGLRLVVSAAGTSAAGVLASPEGMEGDARTRLGPRVLELARKVRVASDLTAGRALDAKDLVADRLDQNLSMWEVFEARYKSSGGVELDAALPIHRWLRPLLADLAEGRERPGAAVSPTGLLVDARGLKVTPAVAPRLQDASGTRLYEASTLTEFAASQRAPAVYVHDPADPAAARRLGPEPLMVRAESVMAGTDLVLEPADAERLRQAVATADFLAAGNVVIVVGP